MRARIIGPRRRRLPNVGGDLREEAAVIDDLNRAIDHIEQHLDADIDVEELARIALTSTYHLRRMFSTIAGMPLSAYVRRRRMTLAAADVRAGRGSLLDVALRYGYGSTEAFSRAFRSVHGVAPRDARADGVELTMQPRLSFRLTIEGGDPMHHRIVEKDAFTLAGKRVRVPLQHHGVNPRIAAFIEALPRELHARIAALSDQEPAGIIAATQVLDPAREEGGDVDYYHAAATSGPVPDDLDALRVPAGMWAVFEVSGPFPDALQRLWADTAAVWFPSNPYRSVPGPELVRMDLAEDASTATCELWTPVEPEPTG
jgi:AraC family transcriptional regulator